MASFRDTIDSVRERIDLVELIGRDIELHPAGSVLKGHSPWRQDKNPSFVVWPHTQTWKDFSGDSRQGGDCIDYIMQRDNESFMNALQFLAAEAKIELPDVENAESEHISERRRLESLLTEAADYYFRVLPEPQKQSWLKEHYGFSDKTIDDLKLGWADGNLFAHLTQSFGATHNEALATGLFVQTKDGRVFDFFQNRLVFPYWRRGRVVYFIARKTEKTAINGFEEAKYKKLLTRSERHSYVSPLIQNDTFYNEDAARSGNVRQLLITEGVTDCIAAMQAGIACISPVTVRFRRKDLPKLIELTKTAREIIICNDTEENGVGESGALETAAELKRAGRPVRIAKIPCPAEKSKIDVNELVASKGAEALKEVLKNAQEFGAHLIERIPEDISKFQLSKYLDEVLPQLQNEDPIFREGYLDLIKSRFKLKGEAMRALAKRLKSGFVESSDKSGDEESTALGEIIERDCAYFAIEPGGFRPISDFVFRPTRRVQLEEGEAIEADIETQNGKILRACRLNKKDWGSKRQLIAALKSMDTSWCGSDDQTQGLQHLLAAQDLPIVQGATRCGYREIDGNSYWVEPTRALTATGEAPPNRLVFWNTGDDLSRRLRPLLPVTPQVEAATAAYVLPRLLKLNTPEVMLPIIGWFFATPLKPRLQQILKHFPFLCVWGTQGSGKTSLIKEIFWPLFGVEDSDLTSVTDTEFTLIRRFSDSESIPACLDEYKIGDMHKTHRSRLHRLLRRVYAGESECRGRTDFSVVRFPLRAPICLCGEMRPSEPALLERIVTACPNKSLREMDPESVRAFAELDREKTDVGLLTRGIIQFLLASDTHSTVELARKALDETLAGQEIAGRVRDNLTAVFCGLIHFEEYAHHLGIELPTLDLGALVQSQCDDIFDGKAGAVKSGCDQFLEQLSDLATTNGIQQFSHYTYTSEGHLALHLGACHMAYAENCRRTSYSGEIIERNMLVRQLQENQRRQGYVLQVSRTVNFRGTKRRAVIIDLERAKQCLDVDDFPKVSEGYYSSASPYSD